MPANPGAIANNAAVACAPAGNALQVHGGKVYAVEHPINRAVCGTRIFDIVGTGEQFKFLKKRH